MAQQKILVIEDDKDIRELINLYLKNQGYLVETAEDGREGLQRFKQSLPDLVILDLLMPYLDGFQVGEEIRKESNVPILFLSCKQEPEDIVKGLELGGDDYITKPFDPQILVARVKANLRRKSYHREKQVITYGELEVNLVNYDVKVHGVSINLAAKERELLFLLASHPNQAFSFDDLYSRIWGVGSYGDTRTVMVHISNIRKKIEQNPSSPQYIQTIRGFGYKWGLEEA